MAKPVVLALCVASLFSACGRSEMTRESSKQAVIIYLQTSSIDFDQVTKTEDELVESVDGQGLGEVDGHELAVDGSEVVYYLYGPDADALFEAVEPIIRRVPARDGSYVIKRYGDVEDPDAREVRIDLQSAVGVPH